MDEPISDVINTSNTSKEHTYNLDGESFSGYGGVFGLSERQKIGKLDTILPLNHPITSDLGFTTENDWKKHSINQKYKYRSNGIVRSGNIEIERLNVGLRW